MSALDIAGLARLHDERAARIARTLAPHDRAPEAYRALLHNLHLAGPVADFIAAHPGYVEPSGPVAWKTDAS